MSEINSSNQSLTKILDKLGINSAKEKFTPKETKDQLGDPLRESRPPLGSTLAPTPRDATH